MASLPDLLDQIQQAHQLSDHQLALVIAQATQTRFSFPHLQPQVDELFVYVQSIPVERRSQVIAVSIEYLKASRFLGGIWIDQMADMLMQLV